MINFLKQQTLTCNIFKMKIPKLIGLSKKFKHSLTISTMWLSNSGRDVKITRRSHYWSIFWESVPILFNVDRHCMKMNISILIYWKFVSDVHVFYEMAKVLQGTDKAEAQAQRIGITHRGKNSFWNQFKDRWGRNI